MDPDSLSSMSFNGVENAILDYAIGELELQLRELGIVSSKDKAGLGNHIGIKYTVIDGGKLTAFKDGNHIEGLVPVNCYNFESRGDLASIVQEFLRWKENPSEYGRNFFLE
jgi:hypothetical protein